MTGATDYLSDGERVIAVENGHPYLGQVTGVCISSHHSSITTNVECPDWLRHRHDLRLLLDCPPVGQTSRRAIRHSHVRDRG
jgi:hypothetical protein